MLESKKYCKSIGLHRHSSPIRQEHFPRIRHQKAWHLSHLKILYPHHCSLQEQTRGRDWRPGQSWQFVTWAKSLEFSRQNCRVIQVFNIRLIVPHQLNATGRLLIIKRNWHVTSIYRNLQSSTFLKWIYANNVMWWSISAHLVWTERACFTIRPAKWLSCFQLWYDPISFDVC